MAVVAMADELCLVDQSNFSTWSFELNCRRHLNRYQRDNVTTQSMVSMPIDLWISNFSYVFARFQQVSDR